MKLAFWFGIVSLLGLPPSRVGAQEPVPALPYQPGLTDELIDEPGYVEQDLKRHWQGLEEQIVLREVDKKALSAAKRWRDAEGATDPQQGVAGRVEFAFGQTLPKIVCAPRRVCDIELEEGESISPHSVHCGDRDSWNIAPARMGATPHLIISPKFSGLRTNLTVLTDRRVYHMELESLAEEHMPFVSFTYPPNQQALWAHYMREAGRDPEKKEKKPDPTNPACNVRVDPRTLYYGYEVEKAGWWRARRRINWAPTRVYDDGQTTTLELPREVMANKLPTLFVTDGKGKKQMVTYQVCGNILHLQRVFREALLVRDVGTSQERVIIRRKPEGE